jgi:hypothetical protein
MHKKIAITLVVLLIAVGILTAGCSPSPEVNTPTPTPTPTATPTASPTPTPTVEALPSQVGETAPIITPEPTPPPTLEPTPTPTPTIAPTPTPTSIPDCDRYNTGEIVIENHSLYSTYDVYINGMKITTIYAGGSTTQTLIAASYYNISCRFIFTDQPSCLDSTLYLSRCDKQIISCDIDRQIPTPTPVFVPPALLNVTWSDENSNTLIDAGDSLAFIFNKPMRIETLNDITFINLRLAGYGTPFGTTLTSCAWSAGDTILTVVLGSDCSENFTYRCFDPSSDVKDKDGNADATINCVPISQ